MTPNRALALGRQRYPSGHFMAGRIHAAVPATSGVPQTAPGGRAYQTHRTHGRKISCIRLYLSLGAVRGRAASRCDPLRLIPRLGRICVSDTFVFDLLLLLLTTDTKVSATSSGSWMSTATLVPSMLFGFSKYFSKCLLLLAVRLPLLDATHPLAKGKGSVSGGGERTAFFYVS